MIWIVLLIGICVGVIPGVLIGVWMEQTAEEERQARARRYREWPK